MTIPIPLRRRDGYIREFAWVDATDYERPEVSKPTWRLLEDRGVSYAVRGERVGGRFTNFRLHRVILGASGAVDHENGNGLDNRRQNIRAATQGENNQNVKLKTNNTSGHKGVDWHKLTGKWRAQISFPGRRFKHLGLFTNLADAVAAYDVASAEHHPFAAHRRDRKGAS